MTVAPRGAVAVPALATRSSTGFRYVLNPRQSRDSVPFHVVLKYHKYINDSLAGE
jgi:hypothetical protein